MELGLKGKRALVTGASKGIGRATADALAAEGCDLVLVSRTGADLEMARTEIERLHPVGISVEAADLSQSRMPDRLAENFRISTFSLTMPAPSRAGRSIWWTKKRGAAPGT